MKKSRKTERDELLRSLENYLRECEGAPPSDVLSAARKVISLQEELVRARLRILVEMECGVRNNENTASLHGVDDMLVRAAHLRHEFGVLLSSYDTEETLSFVLEEIGCEERMHLTKQTVPVGREPSVCNVPLRIRSTLLDLLRREVGDDRFEQLVEEASNLRR